MPSSITPREFQRLQQYWVGKDFQHDGHLFPIDKPLGWTSFDVVSKIRLMFRHYLGIRKIKVGHAGTLDPLATGLLVICIGRATKLVQQLTQDDKCYQAQITLGGRTPSHDLETPVAHTESFAGVEAPVLEAALVQLAAQTQQLPPLYSAKRIGGTRAYKLARRGEAQELEPVPITIHSLTLDSFEQGKQLELTIRCSKGTFVRALARDLGELLGCGAYLSGLRRIESGEVSVDHALGMADVEAFLKIIGPSYTSALEQHPAQ